MPTGDRPPLFSEFALQWLASRAVVELKAQAFCEYSGIVHRHLIPEFGHTPLPELAPQSIQEAHMKISLSRPITSGLMSATTTKNRKNRTIEVAPEIIELVTHHMKTAPHAQGEPVVIFPSKRGKPVHYSDWNRDVLKPLVSSLGRPKMGTHDFRHTFASHALSQGTNIKALQEILGHADAALTLNRYSHLIPSDGRSAADRMANFLLREETTPLYCPSPLTGTILEEVA